MNTTTKNPDGNANSRRGQQSRLTPRMPYSKRILSRAGRNAKARHNDSLRPRQYKTIRP